MSVRQDSRLGVLVSAFVDDAVSRWLVPDSARRHDVYDEWFGMVLAHADRVGEVRAGPACTQVWFPCTSGQLPELVDEECGRRLLSIPGVDAARFRAFADLTAERHPLGPHQYLALIGVAPSKQGTGVGTEALTESLRDFDAAGTPTYLEASSSRSRQLYLRTGYYDLGDPIELPDGPLLHPMWRDVGGR